MDCPVSPTPDLNFFLALVREFGPFASVTIIIALIAGLIVPIVLCVNKCGGLTSISGKGIAGWAGEFQAEFKSNQKDLLAKIEALGLKSDSNINTLKTEMNTLRTEMAQREMRADQLLRVEIESIKNSLAVVQSSITALDNRVGRVEKQLDQSVSTFTDRLNTADKRLTLLEKLAKHARATATNAHLQFQSFLKLSVLSGSKV